MLTRPGSLFLKIAWRMPGTDHGATKHFTCVKLDYYTERKCHACLGQTKKRSLLGIASTLENTAECRAKEKRDRTGKKSNRPDR